MTLSRSISRRASHGRCEQVTCVAFRPYRLQNGPYTGMPRCGGLEHAALVGFDWGSRAACVAGISGISRPQTVADAIEHVMSLRPRNCVIS
jgi:hypothetical protein